MNNLSRRNFIKASAVAGLGSSIAGISGGCVSPAKSADADSHGAAARPGNQRPVHELTTNPRERIRVAVIGLHRGMVHVDSALNIEFAEVVAVCDLHKERAVEAANACEKKSGKRPAIYGGTENIWEQMVDRDDIDAVYIATPWEWHVPMALRSLERGKHAFVEVPAALTVADCWRLVNASERTRRHCVLLENCCYGENELFILNLARQGIFGELNHAECAYLHDLRGTLFNLDGEGLWRRAYHTQHDGNLYPTHGLGPVAQTLGVGRGDQFKFLVSMSSPQFSLTKYRDEHNPNNGQQAGEKYICGDLNTSMVKTESGRTIMVQHAVVSPRPYSRINAMCGSEATFFDYPPRLAINNPKALGLTSPGSHEWLDEKDMAIMRQKFTHPLWQKLRERSQNGGHGGMDFVMNWRLLDNLRRGATPDSVVYDAAAWSCLVEISARSVAAGSAPVAIPDFTRGLWKTMKPLEIAEAVKHPV
jgi:glycosyl hydrolase family 109/GFO/IDH/MocA oxidoreductase family protein